MFMIEQIKNSKQVSIIKLIIKLYKIFYLNLIKNQEFLKTLDEIYYRIRYI